MLQDIGALSWQYVFSSYTPQLTSFCTYSFCHRLWSGFFILWNYLKCVLFFFVFKKQDNTVNEWLDYLNTGQNFPKKSVLQLFNLWFWSLRLENLESPIKIGKYSWKEVWDIYPRYVFECVYAHVYVRSWLPLLHLQLWVSMYVFQNISGMTQIFNLVFVSKAQKEV